MGKISELWLCGRGVATVAAEPMYAKEAKERQKKGRAKIPYPKGKAVEFAAADLNISPCYVSDAKAIKAGLQEFSNFPLPRCCVGPSLRLQ